MRNLLCLSVILVAVCGLPVKELVQAAFPNLAGTGLNTPELVFGGSRAQSGQFPMQVYYNFTWAIDDKVMRCGGTIISTTHVLTAAHCTFDLITPSHVMVGGVSIDDKSPHVQWRRISRVIPHRGFDIYSGVKYDDIAVMEISPPFEFNDFVKTATIVLDDETLLQRPTAVVSGYGASKTENGLGIKSNELLYSEVDLFSSNYCNETWNGTIIDSQFCAGAAGRGIGHGDSGGPIQVRYNGELVQVGLTSFGDGNTEGEYNQDILPSVFTRVSKYCDFIETATKGVVKCSNLSTTTAPSTTAF